MPSDCRSRIDIREVLPPLPIDLEFLQSYVHGGVPEAYQAGEVSEGLRSLVICPSSEYLPRRLELEMHRPSVYVFHECAERAHGRRIRWPGKWGELTRTLRGQFPDFLDKRLQRGRREHDGDDGVLPASLPVGGGLAGSSSSVDQTATKESGTACRWFVISRHNLRKAV